MTLPDSSLSNQDLDKLKTAILRQFKDIQSRPFRVSIVGQTGVGKSSLLNALFNTALKTDSVKPCTKEIEEIPITNREGHTLLFYDLPGIGESVEADARYLQSYRSHLLESDVVLWAIHADSRSVTFDLKALHEIVGGFDKTQQAQLMGKLTLVLTKVDTLYSPPWYLLKLDEKVAKFIPSEKVSELLTHKAGYYQEQFLRPYSNLIVSKTYNDCKFNVVEENLSFDEAFIYYNGALDLALLATFKQRYPQYANVFDRLYDNYQVIPCSAYFRFNLNKLLLVIVNKLGPDAVVRFRNFFDESTLDRMSLSSSKEFCNLVVFDHKKNKLLFSLPETKLAARSSAIWSFLSIKRSWSVLTVKKEPETKF